MFRWILAALAALGLLGSGVHSGKSSGNTGTTNPGGKHLAPMPEDGGGGSGGGGSTDGDPTGH